MLGDPWDSANPLGFAAILAADERAETFAAGEEALDRYGFAAEFVPEQLGGRLTGLDRMVAVVRSVARYDLGLAFGHSGSSFIASTNVWVAGDPEQQRLVSDLLLRGQRIAAAYHELDHGNDFLRAQLEATTVPGGFRLTGRKEVITNARRATLLIVFARTGKPLSPRSHSLLLVDVPATAPGALRHVPRYATSGMRGVQLGGLEFDACPVPATGVLGKLGHGIPTALRAFQVTRSTLPAMACASLDTGIRVAMRFGGTRVLAGRAVNGIPHVRRALVDAFVDLLVCDCFATVAVRALHLLPAEAGAYAAAVKYVVPRRLMAAMRRLSSFLGASFYQREGPYAIFQKHLRDLAPAVFGHASPASCLTMLLSHLPSVARQGQAEPAPAAVDLFRLGRDLPPMSFPELAVSSGGRDSLTAYLLASIDEIRLECAGERAIQDLIDRVVADHREVGRSTSQPRAGSTGPGADAEAFALAARYANLLAAAACVNVWWCQRRAGDPFLGATSWLVAALARVVAGPADAQPAVDRTADLWYELLDRFDRNLSFDLSRTALG
jgi:alkylation response protein AidB-like acyl-CoA dehydrogenase